MPQYLWPLIVSFAITILTTPLTIKLAEKYGFVDNPRTHKHPALIHTKIIPRAGGIPLFLAISISSVLFLPIDKHLVGILGAGLLAVIVGTLDDKFDLSPYIRFGINFVIAGIIVASGIGIAYITNPLGGVISLDKIDLVVNFFGQHHLLLLADLFGLVWIVWTMNMLNWSKGVDGQMPGMVGIAAIVIAILALRFINMGDTTQIPVSKLAFITAGAAFGFLVFNWHPAKIFPGYGATILGLMLATLSILSGAKIATALLVLGVPTIDALVSIIRRVLAGKSPFRGDRGHLHHHLLALGWSQEKIALFYWLFCVILGAVALILDSQGKVFAGILVTVVIGGTIIWLKLFSMFSKQPDPDNGLKT